MYSVALLITVMLTTLNCNTSHRVNVLAHVATSAELPDADCALDTAIGAAAEILCVTGSGICGAAGGGDDALRLTSTCKLPDEPPITLHPMIVPLKSIWITPLTPGEASTVMPTFRMTV